MTLLSLIAHTIYHGPCREVENLARKKRYSHVFAALHSLNPAMARNEDREANKRLRHTLISSITQDSLRLCYRRLVLTSEDPGVSGSSVLNRDLPDESRGRNADFALRYAERRYAHFRQEIMDDGHLYLDSVVEHLLGNKAMERQPLTEQKLQNDCDKLHLCQQIVVNSVGVEDRWTKIEGYRREMGRLKQWLSDVECEVLADSLEASHRARTLVYQRRR
jgi:hypothetical protein